MIRRTLLSLVMVIGVSAHSLGAPPQQAESLDYPEEVIKEANKQLDSRVNMISMFYGFPLEFSHEERAKLLKKYLGEADRSPYFWVYMEKEFVAARARLLRTCSNCYANSSYLGGSVVKESLPVIFASMWGTLILRSEPAGADVFIQLTSSRTKEGQTIIKRRYPEGSYTFVIEMNGYKSKAILVSINKNRPIEEKIILEKQ